MDHSIETALGSNEVGVFINAARHFIERIETPFPQARKERLHFILATVLDLYKCAQELPEVGTLENDPDEVHVSHEKRMMFFNEFSARLDGDRYYWHVLDPLDHTNQETGCGDLGDDLCDTYFDLRSAMDLFDQEGASEKRAALWYFRFGFDHHWGEHCANAIYGLHYALRK